MPLPNSQSEGQAPGQELFEDPQGGGEQDIEIKPPEGISEGAEGVEPKEPQGGQPTETPAAQAPAPSVTSEDIARILREGFEKVAPPQQQPQPQQRQYTQEEYDRHFNVYRPKGELIKAIREGDEAAALVAVNDMVNGIVKHAVTMAHYSNLAQREEIEQRLSPALQYIQRAQVEQWKKEFLDQNKDLVGYEPIMTQIADAAKARGVKFKTKEEAFKFVADETKKVIATIPGLQKGGAAPAAAAQPGQQSQRQSRMPALSRGGQGGVGGTSGSSAGGSRRSGLEVFD